MLHWLDNQMGIFNALVNTLTKPNRKNGTGVVCRFWGNSGLDMYFILLLILLIITD